MGIINKFAVLASGGGTDLQSLIDAVECGEIKAQICVVICDREAHALNRAKMHNIPAVLVDKNQYSSSFEFNRALLEVLKNHQAEAVVLAGFLSIIDKSLVVQYPNKIINIHPSLIPSFCGMGFYGQKVHQSVIDYGCKITGVTVHFVDENADTGAIIAQSVVEVLPEDTADTLSKRVLECEHKLLPKVIGLFCQGRVEVTGRMVKIL